MGTNSQVPSELYLPVSITLEELFIICSNYAAQTLILGGEMKLLGDFETKKL